MSTYIDWGYDAARLGAIGLTLTETGGGGATGAISLSGQYMHSEEVSATYVRRLDPVTGENVYDFAESYLVLATELMTALNAIGNATYAVAFDPVGRDYTITASGGGVTTFDLTSITIGGTRMLGEVYKPSSLAWRSQAQVWHYSYAENLGFSRWDRRAAAAEGAETLTGADGSVRGLSPIGVPELLDFVVPSEPREAIRSDDGGGGSYTARGWTWQRAVLRCRSIEPAIIAPGDGSRLVAYLRPDYTFSPRLKSADYLEVQDVPLSWHVVGELV